LAVKVQSPTRKRVLSILTTGHDQRELAVRLSQSRATSL